MCGLTNKRIWSWKFMRNLGIVITTLDNVLKVFSTMKEHLMRIMKYKILIKEDSQMIS